MVSVETVLIIVLLVNQASVLLAKLDLKLMLMVHVDEVVQMLIRML